METNTWKTVLDGMTAVIGGMAACKAKLCGFCTSIWNRVLASIDEIATVIISICGSLAILLLIAIVVTLVDSSNSNSKAALVESFCTNGWSCIDRDDTLTCMDKGTAELVAYKRCDMAFGAGNYTLSITNVGDFTFYKATAK